MAEVIFQYLIIIMEYLMNGLFRTNVQSTQRQKFSDIKYINRYALIFTILCFSLFLQAKNLFVESHLIHWNVPVQIEYNIKNSTNNNLRIYFPNSTFTDYTLLNAKGQIEFVPKSDQAFLSPNWHEYKIILFHNQTQIDSLNLHINDKKILYMTVYVDDIGRSGMLEKEGEKWYTSIGGKINYGFELDDAGKAISLKKIIKNYHNQNQYIFHHFHSIAYNGPKVLLSINRLIGFQHIKYTLGIKIKNRIILLILVTLSFLCILKLIRTKNKFRYLYIFLPFVTAVFILSLVVSGIVEMTPIHWKYYLSNDKNDIQWNQTFLLKIKAMFEKEHYQYPIITRHGMNIPPRGLNEFYTKKMGVLADASFIFSHKGKMPGKEVQKNYNTLNSDAYIESMIAQAYTVSDTLEQPNPYYTNINGDFDVPWDYREENRGVIEMPLSNDNPYYGLSPDSKKLIKNLPNGALISTFIHPGQNLTTLKPFIIYTESCSMIEYVTAEEYLSLYMQNNPRPVIWEPNSGNIIWAYLGNDSVIPISKIKQQIQTFDQLKQYFFKLPPYIIVNQQMDNIPNYLYQGKISNQYVYKLVN
jgi:hypothetical protein